MRIILQQITFAPLRSLNIKSDADYFLSDGLNGFMSLTLAYGFVSFLHYVHIVKKIAQILLSVVNIIELLEPYQFSGFIYSIAKQNYVKFILLYPAGLFLCALFPMHTILVILVKNGICLLAASISLPPLAHMSNVRLHKLPIQSLQLEQIAPYICTRSQKIVAMRSMSCFASSFVIIEPEKYSWIYQIKLKLLRFS